MKKTTKKRMSKAPSKKASAKSAKRDAYNIGGQTRAGKAMAKNRARKRGYLNEALSAARSSRKKK